MCFTTRFAVIEVAPIAISPRMAARRPRWPPATASTPAITTQSRESLAAFEIQVIGTSSVGVGVLATAW